MPPCPMPRRIAAGFALAIALTTSASAQTVPVKAVEFDAPSVGRKMKYNVILPADYESTDRRYPAIYLLHGLTGNYRNWARMGAGRAAAGHDLIVVMPDAGNSWYVNWAESEGDAKNAWEDCIVKDLIGHVDSTYRTIAAREGRAINGLSMGGYGALTLGLRHPEMFATIGSHSGAVAFAKGVGERLRRGDDLSGFRRREPSNEPNAEIGIEGFSSQAERTPKGKLFATAEQAEANDPFALVAKVPAEKLPHIYLDCGTDDRLIRDNVELAKLLMDKKIPFTFAESPGGHTGQYWAREIGHSMAVQAHILRRELAKAKAGD